MDQRGVHSIDCPNHLSYSRLIIRLSDGFEYLGYDHDQIVRPNFQNLAQRLLNVMRAIPVSPPSIIDGDFEIKGECSVCYDECEQSHRVLKPADCDHCFHEKCLMPWISDHSTCPSCRGETPTILRKN
jgi:hypothetical protein